MPAARLVPLSGLRNGPAISSRFEAQSGAAEPWAWRENAERWLGLVPSPPIEHSSLKVAKQEILVRLFAAFNAALRWFDRAKHNDLARETRVPI